MTIIGIFLTVLLFFAFFFYQRTDLVISFMFYVTVAIWGLTALLRPLAWIIGFTIGTPAHNLTENQMLMGLMLGSGLTGAIIHIGFYRGSKSRLQKPTSQQVRPWTVFQAAIVTILIGLMVAIAFVRHTGSNTV